MSDGLIVTTLVCWPTGVRWLPASIVCPRCGWRSYNLPDIAQRYCGHCHRFHDDPQAMTHTMTVLPPPSHDRDPTAADRVVWRSFCSCALSDALRAFLRSRRAPDPVVACALVYELAALVARNSPDLGGADALLDEWTDQMKHQIGRLGVTGQTHAGRGGRLARFLVLRAIARATGDTRGPHGG